MTNDPFRTSAAPIVRKAPGENHMLAHEVHKMLTGAGYVLRRHTNGTPQAWVTAYGDELDHSRVMAYIRARVYFAAFMFPRLARWWCSTDVAPLFVDDDARMHARVIPAFERELAAVKAHVALHDHVAEIERAVIGE